MAEKADINVPRDVMGAVAHWSRRFWMTARGVELAVVGHEHDEVSFARAEWTWRSRTALIGEMPTPWTDALRPRIDADAIDPWASEPGVDSGSRRIVRCAACAGTKTVTCPACGGALRRACDGCGGSGLVRSPKTGKLIQCRRCKSTGSRKCECKKGEVACGQCDGQGRVEQWVVIRETRHTDVTALEPDGVQGVVAGAAPESAGLDLAVRWTGLPSQAEPALRDWLEHPVLRGAAPSDAARLDSVSLSLFRAEVVTVEYKIAWRRGRVAVVGRDRRVVPQPESRPPFHLRQNLLLVAVGAALLEALWVTGWYTGQDPWMVGTVNASVLRWLMLGLPVVVLPFVAALVLPCWKRRLRRMGLAGLPLLVCTLLQIAAASTGDPSLAEAEEAYSLGDLARADAIASACVRLDIDGDAARALNDRLLLDQFSALTDPAAAWAATAWDFQLDETRVAARTRALALTVAALRADQDRDDFSTTTSLAALIPESERADDAVRLALIRLHLHTAEDCVRALTSSCAREALSRADELGATLERTDPIRRLADSTAEPVFSKNWPIIKSSKPLLEREAACVSVAPALTLVSLAGTGCVSDTCARIASKCAEIDRAIVARGEAAARAEARRVAAAEAAEARAEARRAWYYAPLVCNDGAYSPTCICGGSHQGCCSWHGGVRGCSQ